MIKQDFYIANLIARYISDEITPEEKVDLENWIKEDPAHETLFNKICSEKHFNEHEAGKKHFDHTIGWQSVQKRIERNNHKERFIRILNYAAIILLPILVISISIKRTDTNTSDRQDYLAQSSIFPGEAKAILTLDNGQVINLGRNVVALDENLNGINIQADSTMLKYSQAEKNTKEEISYNKVETPKGGEYLLVLSDGTKVHLNAMSKLRYPVQFGKNRREVELEGEGYFEVSKNGYPFIVKTNGMQVEVLGTVFNISAYQDEECQTTLISGSVKVKAGEKNSCILQPSQQASILPGNAAIQVRTVDTAFYTSWIKGKIHFKDQRLEDIMKILSRWYDMDVHYANSKVKDILFGCNINRYDEITPFVKLLEETKLVHTKIEGKTITFYN